MKLIAYSDESHKYAYDKTNTLLKIKKMRRIYNDLHTLPRMRYSTRNKQRNSERIQRKGILSGNLQQWEEKRKFDNEQLYTLRKNDSK